MGWRSLWASALPALLCSAAVVGFSVRAEGETCFLEGVGRLAPVEDGLRVVESGAAVLVVGDVLLQLNARRLRACSDLDATLQVAAREGLVPILALRRGESVHSVVLVIASTPGAAAVKRATTAASVATPTALRVGGAAAGSLQQMVAALRRFDQETALPVVGSQAFARRLDLLRATYAALVSTAPGVEAVEPVLQYYDAAKQIVLYRDEVASRQADRQDPSRSDLSRSRPPPGASYEYSTGGPVSEWLERYPFLEGAVIRPPRRFVGPLEEAGHWQPDEAVRLLMEKARVATDAIALRLSSDAR